jgi:GNAT superfamily N-acetyltransferase
MTPASAFCERPASADDAELLFLTYAASRAEEIAAWGWTAAQQETFLRMQFRARAQSYAFAYPGAAHTILMVNGAAAGSAIVWRRESELRLVDIALLPEFRNRGLGTQFVARLIHEAAAAQIPLCLSVFRGNRAERLYRRLGFVAKSDGGIYIEMEHNGG